MLVGAMVGWAEPPEPTNGVAYLLLPNEFAETGGVYRLNSYERPYPPMEHGQRIFDLNFAKAKIVSGIYIDHENGLSLLGGGSRAKAYGAVEEVGWLPDYEFSAGSPAFLRLIGQEFNQAELSRDIEGAMPYAQFAFRTTNYDNDFWDYAHWPISPHFPGGSVAKHENFRKQAGKDAKGHTYAYTFEPVSLGFFRNLPLWNGPGQSATGIVSADEPQSVILPNRWGGILWHAMGTANAPAAHINRLMDGRDNRPRYLSYDLRLQHDDTPAEKEVPLVSPYWDAKYIIAAVKRTYEDRLRAMDLFGFVDEEAPPAKPPYRKQPTAAFPRVVKAEDWKIVDYFTKSSGLNDIPGGELMPNVPLKVEPHLQVIHTTSDRTYTFNPQGKKTKPFTDEEAALRVMYQSRSQAFELKPEFVKNADYFTLLGLSLDQARQIAVSPNFDTAPEPMLAPPDYVFVSMADRFVMQDTWWGNGGVAYEYFARDTVFPGTASLTFKAGHIYRLNFIDSSRPLPVDLGEFPGDVDDIGVDGQGNLYVLTTELDVPNEPVWPDPLGMPVGPNLPAEWPNSSITGHKHFAAASSWMRLGVEQPDAPIDEPSQKGDYKDITFKQLVKKIVYKYPVGAGGVYSATGRELWGAVDAGSDEIVRRLQFIEEGKYEWNDQWFHRQLPGRRLADVNGELTVVNFAGRPEVSPTPADCTYSVCRNESAGGGARVSPSAPIFEGEEVTFKVEGYKPYDESGVRKGLKYVGALEGLGPTHVNMVPPCELRDEDGNGQSGGFPSSLFETATHKMGVQWCVDLIEGTNPENEAKVLRSFARGVSPNTGDDTRDFRFKFPHPGNYRVYARIQYRYFDFAELNTNLRPNSLKEFVKFFPSSTEYVSTAKVLYQVQSAPSTANTGFVSGLILYNQSFNQHVEPVQESGDVYNMPENTFPTDLKFSFTAQFVRDANRFDPDQPFQTYGGVGVWDYGDKNGHVYNFAGENQPNNEYNPGWTKPNDPMNMADHGTRVDLPPREKDLQAIRWRLYLYTDYGANLADRSKLRSQKDAGRLIAEGDCSKARLEAKSTDRQFDIHVDLPKDAVKFVMPLDPMSYRLRLELVYPRVKWVESETGNADQPQYRSIVPDDYPLGIVTTVPGEESGVLYEGSGDTAGLFANGDSWFTRVRDARIFPPTITGDSPQQIVQTTGDPVNPVLVNFSVMDNNPNAKFEDFGIRYERPLVIRDPDQKEDRSFAQGKLTAPITEPPTDPEMYKTDEYRKTAAYQSALSEYGDTAGISQLFSPGKDYQNWIGSLTYWIEGNLFDGYGATGPLALDVPHAFSAVGADVEVRTPVFNLDRFDNDPPTLRVTIISATDNRRWEVVLEEKNQDAVMNPKTVDQLASSVLHIACYNLNQSGAEGTMIATQSIEVPGSSNCPNALETYREIKFTDIPNPTEQFLAAIPRVRRSSRLMVNVQIDDNVDYLPLAEANLEIMELRTAESPQSLISGQAGGVSLEPAFTKANAPNFDLPNPRARFAVDMPMMIRSDQEAPGKPQVSIRLYARDAAGNERAVVIPVLVGDSTFETRILESQETRQ
jgi:hypothetical protein